MFDGYYLKIAVEAMQEARDAAEKADMYIAQATNGNKDLGFRKSLGQVIRKLNSEIVRSNSVIQDKDLTPE